MTSSLTTAVAGAIDMRDAFFEQLYELAAADANLVFLTDDMDAFALQRFKRDFPERFINVGVAEQNMINLAAGLAMCGKRVFTYGIASFVTLRCFEQIKVNVCSMNLPVTIIGVGAGFSFGFDGPTHHGTQDVAAMRILPEMTILNPSDSRLAAACARLAHQADSPTYVRLDKGTFPELYQAQDDLRDGFKILTPPARLMLVGTGYATHLATKAAEILRERGRDVGVVDVFRLKPIGSRFVTDVLERSELVVTIEENSIAGGLGTIVAELAVDCGVPARIRRFGVRDEQFITYGTREWFLRANELDPVAIAERLASTT